jgi:malonate decarboxylase alpha subunit
MHTLKKRDSIILLVQKCIPKYLKRTHKFGIEVPTSVKDDFELDLPPVMVYGDDITHLVTEEGIASLHKCKNLQEREQAIRGVAGFTPVGLKRDHNLVKNLIERKIIQRPSDLGVDPRMATRNLLAARSIKDLVNWSDGLYNPPKRFRNW